ncbi:MAG: leucyl aminopeptidase family protein, partial [Paracoccaceae bacterium]|nr:leucyl aminopeptidase family protein [Paracoccaceae bacterium]
MIFAFADPAVAALPIYVLDEAGLPAWLALQPLAVQNWLAATEFSAKLGDLALLQVSDGQLSGAVLGFGTVAARARQRFGLVKNIGKLPAGTWALASDLTPRDQDE